LTNSGGVFDLAEKSKSLEELEHQIAEPGFWDDNDKAQKVLKERSALNNVVEGWNSLKSSLAEAAELLEMAAEEDEYYHVEACYGMTGREPSYIEWDYFCLDINEGAEVIVHGTLYDDLYLKTYEPIIFIDRGEE